MSLKFDLICGNEIRHEDLSSKKCEIRWEYLKSRKFKKTCKNWMIAIISRDLIPFEDNEDFVGFNVIYLTDSWGYPAVGNFLCPFSHNMNMIPVNDLNHFVEIMLKNDEGCEIFYRLSEINNDGDFVWDPIHEPTVIPS